MGVGDLSFAAVASLKSIDDWIATINSNMAGAGRVGYKASRVKFSGGAVTSERPTVSPRLGVKYAEQSLGIAQTTVDYSQGAITASTDFTHMAIQRTSSSPGMFVLSNVPDPANPPVGVATQYYYTFDGEFHWDTSGQLVNADGLYVMSNDFNGDGTTGDLGVVNQATHVTNDQINLNQVAINVWPNPQIELDFSRYGATVFEEVAGATNPPGSIANVDSVGNYTQTNGTGRVIPNALEASNASLTASTPELALAQKMYAAIAKVIQVALANIDTALQIGPR